MSSLCILKLFERRMGSLYKGVVATSNRKLIDFAWGRKNEKQSGQRFSISTLTTEKTIPRCSGFRKRCDAQSRSTWPGPCAGHRAWWCVGRVIGQVLGGLERAAALQKPGNPGAAEDVITDRLEEPRSGASLFDGAEEIAPADSLPCQALEFVERLEQRRFRFHDAGLFWVAILKFSRKLIACYKESLTSPPGTSFPLSPTPKWAGWTRQYRP